MSALERGAERALGALLAWDERLIDRVDPPHRGPVDVAGIPWGAPIQASWEAVRAELDALLADGVQLPETDDLVGVHQGAEGSWTTYVLHWYGTWLPTTGERCPATVALLRGVPGLQIAGFTVLGPGAHLPRHRGPAKSLRWQLGVRVPGPEGACRLRIGDETVVWRDGLATAFDDRTEHEAWNDSSAERYVLFAQTAWPVRGWVGRVHAANHRIFGAATRRIARRADELDRRLNAS